MPVTLLSDQMDGSNKTIPNPNMNAGTQARGIFHGDANKLAQVTTLQKLHATEDTPAIEDFFQAEIFDVGELATKSFGDGLGLIGFTDVNRVLALAVLVARPEKELVVRNIRRL